MRLFEIAFCDLDTDLGHKIVRDCVKELEGNYNIHIKQWSSKIAQLVVNLTIPKEKLFVT